MPVMTLKDTLMDIVETDVQLLVQKQLDTYNARDIDAYMSCWADDCETYEFPDKLLARGAANVRIRNIERFRETNLFARLINRIAADDMVIDQEIVSRTFPEGPGEVDVIAIYQVRGGKIAKAWFKMGTPRLYALPLER
jgi:hypothetical protein